MANVYVDPDKLEEFASKLVSFSREVESIQQRLWASLQRLSVTWKDQEYEKFVSNFLQFEKVLGELRREIEQVYPRLKEDAQYIREYFKV